MHFWAYLLCIATGVSAIAFRKAWARDAMTFFRSGRSEDLSSAPDVDGAIWVYLVGGVFFVVFGMWGLISLN